MLSQDAELPLLIQNYVSFVRRVRDERRADYLRSYWRCVPDAQQKHRQDAGNLTDARSRFRDLDRKQIA